MSYHGCPIEPGDWSDGDDPADADDCEHCHGTGWENEDRRTPCEHCDGEGWIVSDDWPDYFDPTNYF